MADIKSLREKFEENPDSMAFAPLSDAYRKEGDLENAEEVCLEGLKRHPNYVGGRMILARIYLEAEKFLLVASVSQSVIKMESENLMAHSLLWQALVKLERDKDAINVLDRLLVLNPSDQDAEKALVEIKERLASGKKSDKKSETGGGSEAGDEGTEEAGDKEAGDSPDEASDKGREGKVSKGENDAEIATLLRVAELYFKKGQIAKSVETAQEALELDDSHKGANALLKKIQEVQEEESKGAAQEPAEKPGESKPDSEDASQKLDMAAFDSDDSKESAGDEGKDSGGVLDLDAFDDEEEAKNDGEDKNSEEESGKEISDSTSEAEAPSADEPPSESNDEQESIETEEAVAVADDGESGSDLLKEVLSRVNEKPGILASMIVSPDGDVLAKDFKVDIEASAISKMVARIFQDTQKSVDRMDQGVLNQVMITAVHGQLFINSTPSGILAILATEKVKIGILRLAINEAVRRITKASA